MKASAKYLNILVPTLIFACVALFYMNGLMSEGFQSSRCEFNQNTGTIYSIICKVTNSPLSIVYNNKIDKTTNGSNVANGGINDFTITKLSSTEIKIESNSNSFSKLKDYNLQIRQSNNWVNVDCTDILTYSIVTGSTSLRKSRGKAAVAGYSIKKESSGKYTLTFKIKGSTPVTSITDDNCKIQLKF
jgi:hypothetical protein